VSTSTSTIAPSSPTMAQEWTMASTILSVGENGRAVNGLEVASGQWPVAGGQRNSLLATPRVHECTSWSPLPVDRRLAKAHRRGELTEAFPLLSQV
jgi:hypothetical protein